MGASGTLIRQQARTPKGGAKRGTPNQHVTFVRSFHKGDRVYEVELHATKGYRVRRV